MQENSEGKDIQNLSVEELFLKAQESFEEAQKRALEENKSFTKTEYFRMDKIGTYRLRILPVAPNHDGTSDRRSYEYPVRQMLMELEKPTNGTGKPSSMYVTVPRATDAGYSIDLIDTYRKLAVAEAEEKDDKKLAEKIGGGSFGGGLKFNYGHAMYILDLNERAKGIQMLTLSHSQFKELDDRKFKLWQKKLAKSPGFPCPISSVYNAYPVEIEKKKNGGKTEYVIEIDNESDNDILTGEELNKLLNLTRIPEIIYHYSRYQYEATIVFLKQCDSKYGLSVMANFEMQAVAEKLGAELPKEDTSSFSFDKRTKDSKEAAANEAGILIDDLFNRFDELQEKGLGDKTEEGQELRALIRNFIDQNKLSIRVTRSTLNKDLLDMIDEAMQDDGADAEEPQQEPEPEETPASNEPAPASRRRRIRGSMRWSATRWPISATS